jgi:hypothetical protein
MSQAPFVNVMTGKKYTVKKNSWEEAWLLLYRDQNGGQVHSINVDNKSFARVEGFKYIFGNSLNRSKFHLGRN